MTGPSTADALSFELSERFLAAAEEWGDSRVVSGSAAVESKVEQALLEIEHLVSGATAVEFDLEGETVVYEPSGDLGAFLDDQAAETGLEPDRLLKLHVDLFARAFLEDDRGVNGGRR
ncbi:hypothetical protein GWG54_08065 [Natronococcus sp. JC468]|uniref:hypothetical protein n=1 Tax=Natronococcus sp. JC468 TaxID=1961921 RepID=UPI00143AF3F1|nr:hypothetical protein [Natronococcus sp. JC468]NKE35774.1 hypothetical protein [Natronococcus sp. JC468]